MNITKGKWEAEDINIVTDCFPIYADSVHVASVHVDENFQEAEANAQLIALAGNLAQKLNLEAYEEVVEACKEALKKMNEYGMLQPDNFLTRALKKATEGH